MTVVALLLVLMPSIGVAAAEPAGVDTAAVDRFMSEYLSRTRLPGAAVAITHGDQVVYVAGYGHDSSAAVTTAFLPCAATLTRQRFVWLASLVVGVWAITFVKGWPE
jgi:CubicO group peptidase (beta-lactamase class C family)